MSNARTICTVCNYIYDEAQGVPSKQIPAAVKFENLAEDWKCPECGSEKEMFQPCSCIRLADSEKTCAVHNTEGRKHRDSIDKSTTVGQLVAEHPMRACVFEQYRIDYCCGGKVSLEEACSKRGFKVEEVIEKLLASDSKEYQLSNEQDWTSASLRDLINHIIGTYHQPLRQDLSRIAPLAEKVARVHGDNHPEMLELLDIFNRFKAQLELHMQKEEMVLFPGIASIEATGSPQIFGCGGGIEHPIEVMNQEHDEAGEAMCTMRRLTNGYTPPEDACNSFRVLLASLAELEAVMHQHVHKENNILFPRALALHNQALLVK